MRLQDHPGKFFGLFCICIALILWPPQHSNRILIDSRVFRTKSRDWCPLPPIPATARDGLQPSWLLLRPGAIETQVKRLSAAVNIATVSYDDNGDVDKDPRWVSFEELQVVLEKTFPLV